MISEKSLYQDVKFLTEEIGVRLAGSDAERKAAEYLQHRFLQYVPKCELEEFSVMQRVVKEEKLKVLINGQWESFSTRLYNMAPTTNGEIIEAEIVYFDSHTDYQRSDLSYLHGKAVLHYGVQIAKEDDYRRLLEAGPAFIMIVDTRYTSELPIANSLLPAFVKKYGAIPTIDVAFFDAWKWIAQGATHAMLNVTGSIVQGISQNVIAELPGTDPDPLYIYAGAHIDSVAGSPGADDNAIGCAILLELARILSQKPHRHTIRLIAFGAEEQLSVGSAEYVRKHRQEIENKGRFLCNFDSCASLAGWNRFVINANEALREKMKKEYNTHGVYYVENLAPDPCNDMFPFTAVGIPGVTLMRNNCESGKFFHHRPDNALPSISMARAADLAEASWSLMTNLSDMEDMRKVYTMDLCTKAQVKSLWESTYGGWETQI